jgi:fluoride ion exporter CrcB/FEX
MWAPMKIGLTTGLDTTLSTLNSCIPSLFQISIKMRFYLAYYPSMLSNCFSKASLVMLGLFFWLMGY